MDPSDPVSQIRGHMAWSASSLVHVVSIELDFLRKQPSSWNRQPPPSEGRFRAAKLETECKSAQSPRSDQASGCSTGRCIPAWNAPPVRLHRRLHLQGCLQNLGISDKNWLKTEGSSILGIRCGLFKISCPLQSSIGIYIFIFTRT